MAKTSKWFVVATEGATTDGRTINRTWIEQMAANYDPKKYGARVNLEHIKWRYMWNDDPHSKCYGDVVGLKTEENAEGKLQLLAQIDEQQANLLMLSIGAPLKPSQIDLLMRHGRLRLNDYRWICCENDEVFIKEEKIPLAQAFGWGESLGDFRVN